MIRIIIATFMFAGLSVSSNASDIYIPGKKTGKTFKGFAQGFIKRHCIDCHDNDTEKGSLSLENLGPVDETNAGLWKTIWAQVTLKEMPPKKKSKVEVTERLLFSDWIVEELKREMRSKGGFHDHRDPKKANYLDHDLLFGPLPTTIRLVPTSTEARLWRVSRQEHITRFNELINSEPKFNAAKPGLRAHGDAVPVNYTGGLKLYFGTDIYRWPLGHTGVNTAHVTSLPAILATDRKHGLENYPDFYSVSSSEATRILTQAKDIIRYMAHGVKSIVVDPETQITDKKNAGRDIAKNLMGTPRAVIYSTKTVRPITPVYELMKGSGMSDSKIRAAVDYLYEALTFLPISKAKSDYYLKLTKESVAKLGKEEGFVSGLSTIFLDGDALFRSELAQKGKPDANGRVMLRDWELGLAVNHALRYIKPDAKLREAIVSGRMRTKADVKREIERMLADDSIRKPRILQFFRDYFDYDLAGYVCKDEKNLENAGIGRADWHRNAMHAASSSTDRLIELILQEDKDVFKKLLTTDKAVFAGRESKYWGENRHKDEMREAKSVLKKLHKKSKALKKEIDILVKKLKANPRDKEAKELLSQKKALSKELKNQKRAVGGKTKPIESPNPKKLMPIYTRLSRGEFKNKSAPEKKLVTMPKSQRLGILTHPSWLVSHSDAMYNHAVHRGIWVREHLLGGGIPDVPITVDAMLPEEPENTLRHRMRVTKEKYCWQCHKKMDPLGLAFEMYNNFGIFRTMEKGKPVDSTGEIIDSGVPGLDGKVDNAIDMIQKIVKSERAEQVFVRYAFRFWMGRNETLNDRPVLQDAYRVYKESGGSMKALIVSLLTSDAFLYRKIRYE